MDRGVQKINTFIKRYTANRFVLAGIVFIVFVGFNWSIYGPAYLSDEVGYLNKAATIAGQTVRVTSSWFGGYSMLIAPAYLVSHDPFIQWKLILVLNGLMWACSSLLLHYILRKLRPQASDRAVMLAIAGAMLYPAWLSMSGYAFATSGFVFIFLISLTALVRSKLTSVKWLTLAALTAGYLFWIHPLGAVYTLLFMAFIGLAAITTKHWKLMIIPFITGGVAFSYIAAVSPFINSLMAGNNSAHYAGTLKAISETILTPGYWERFVLLVLGLAFSLTIATFGIIVFGVYDNGREWLKNRRALAKNVSNLEISIPLLLTLTIVGVILANAASTASNQHIRLDEWVYGRYVDMFALPLIGLGLLAPWKQKVSLAVILLITITGFALSAYTNPNNTLFDVNNKVNIQALWPMHVSSLVHMHEYFIWGLLGAAGVAVTFYAARTGKKAFALVFLVPVVFSAVANLHYHRTILAEHSTVSAPLYTYITTKHTRSDCIGFTPEVDSRERFSLYSYYLHGYDVQTMPAGDWVKQNCSGPYFTYDPSLAGQLGLSAHAVDNGTGLLMLLKQPDTYISTK